MTVTERFIRYIKLNTTSDPDSPATPSTACQFDLANLLVRELHALGITDAKVDEHCYVYAHLPATEGYEQITPIGFIAHMDTAPDFSGEGVDPQIIEGYDGGIVALGDSGRMLDPAHFPHLPTLKGRTLITTNGKTLLGGDDKAGVAEIMTMLERLINEKTEHGPISIGFTPDEEIGRGADLFDVARFGAKFAYTVDGGAEGDIEWENFNAASATVEFSGFSVHPGSSKDTMINAALVATEFASLLPAAETPRHTDGYEGFFHLTAIEGDVERAKMHYIIRDHSASRFEARKQTMVQAAAMLNERYGAGTVGLTLTDSYRNMREMIEPCMIVIEHAREAIRKVGLTPVEPPIRGGTDGARLSFMGLPCPNLGTGGYAGHGPFEHITAEGMEKCVEILLGIVSEYAKE